MSEFERQPLDIIDAMLASGRQRIIIELMRRGKLDPESAITLYEATTRLDVVVKDRAAFEKGEFGPDSPSGRLVALLFKLRGEE